MRLFIIAVFSAVLLAAACKSDSKSKSDEQAQKEKPAPEQDDTGVEKPAKSARPKAPSIPEADVKAVLDAWLAAQNSGDFAAYETLYASKFQGVKRIGTRVFRFERKGWLEDRKRMFRKKMVVEARDAKIATTPRTAQVLFEQRWASGKYEDLGPKKLLIVVEGKDLRIAQEEMLSSEIVAGKRPSELPNNAFAFVLQADSDHYIVLDDVDMPAEHGEPKVVDDGEPMVIMASVKDRDLTKEVLDWRGTTVVVDGECEAKVVGFTLIGRVVPHFGTRAYWNGEHGEDGDEVPSEEEIAESAFSSSHVVLGAKLDNDCGGVYARVKSLPAPVEGEELSDSALKEKAIAAFAELDSVTKQQEGDIPWWKGSISVSIYRHPKSGQTLVSVSADNDGMCGEYSASEWQVFEWADKKLEPLYNSNPPGKISGAIDTDGDGSLELLVEGDGFGTEAALIDPENGGARAKLEYTYNDCPC